MLTINRLHEIRRELERLSWAREYWTGPLDLFRPRRQSKREARLIREYWIIKRAADAGRLHPSQYRKGARV